MMQFLIESAFLTVVGGLLGLCLAAVIAATVRFSTPVPMTITVGYMVLSVLVSGGIGIIAGVYPALKASRLDPIVALTKS
jgi:putative ABC transport system permease protein